MSREHLRKLLEGADYEEVEGWVKLKKEEREAIATAIGAANA